LKILPAAVQTSFRLEKPVSQLIPYVKTLEYDIYGEIALPNTKVSFYHASVLISSVFHRILFGHTKGLMSNFILTGGYPVHAPKYYT